MPNRPSIGYLYECFDVNFKTGTLTWKVRPQSHFSSIDGFARWNSKWRGRTAGTRLISGHIQVKLNDSFILAHRIIWAMFYGAWPDGTVDHKNRDASDNRIENLRGANQSQQNANQGLRSDNTSGYRGVYRDKRNPHRQWFSVITWRGKTHWLGYFSTPEQASLAYQEKQRELFGEFAPT